MSTDFMSYCLIICTILCLVSLLALFLALLAKCIKSVFNDVKWLCNIIKDKKSKSVDCLVDECKNCPFPECNERDKRIHLGNWSD